MICTACQSIFTAEYIVHGDQCPVCGKRGTIEEDEEQKKLKIINIPGPCDITCKHRWTSFEDMKEPCKSCKHITNVDRWVSVHTRYEKIDEEEGIR